MTADLEALLKAHIAAAAAWRRLMDSLGQGYGATEYDAWQAAEQALAGLLGTRPL